MEVATGTIPLDLTVHRDSGKHWKDCRKEEWWTSQKGLEWLLESETGQGRHYTPIGKAICQPEEMQRDTITTRIFFYVKTDVSPLLEWCNFVQKVRFWHCKGVLTQKVSKVRSFMNDWTTTGLQDQRKCCLTGPFSTCAVFIYHLFALNIKISWFGGPAKKEKSFVADQQISG